MVNEEMLAIRHEEEVRRTGFTVKNHFYAYELRVPLLVIGRADEAPGNLCAAQLS